MTPTLVVIDDFLPNPDEVRALGLKQEYKEQYSKGVRSVEQHLDLVDRSIFAWLLGDKTVADWATQPMNARFQYCTAKDPLVYHSDMQPWAATLFLTPDAPVEAGLSLYRSRHNGLSFAPDTDIECRKMYGDFHDRTLWDEVDRIGNRYNRLVLWKARHVHAASAYFGDKVENARMFMVFFFGGG